MKYTITFQLSEDWKSDKLSRGELLELFWSNGGGHAALVQRGLSFENGVTCEGYRWEAYAPCVEVVGLVAPGFGFETTKEKAKAACMKWLTALVTETR